MAENNPAASLKKLAAIANGGSFANAYAEAWLAKRVLNLVEAVSVEEYSQLRRLLLDLLEA